MRFSRLINALGALATLPVLSTALTVGDVMSQSLAHFGERELEKRASIGDILKDIEKGASCGACNALLLVLQALAHTGNDNFTKVITAVCQGLKVQDSDVCAGAIGLEGPILAHDLRTMSVGTKTSDLFCLTVFGLCQWPEVDTKNAPTLSAKPAGVSRPATSGRAPLKVVHISDIHIDLSYEQGASWNCTKNICCRPYTAADQPGQNDTPAGKFGDVHCDTPVTLEESMYTAIETLVPDRNFTIFTGDAVEGAVWLVSQTEVTNDLNDAFGRMRSLGSVYPVTGNHDVAPVNSFPPAAVNTDMSSQWAYDTMSTGWQGWIGSEAAAEVSTNHGSYSVLDKASGLRIISVNTNFWYKQNFWMYEKHWESDPSGMFAWLVNELDKAEAAKERVWILGHMPMGSGDTFHDSSYYFDQIIQRYDATIAATFYGHTHKDQFEIAYSDYNSKSASTATMVSYVAPALTPTSGNPTFRVYDVDPVSFAVLDYTVYYTDINAPTYQTNPVWQKLYSVKEAYGPLVGVTDPKAELTPGFWHDLTTVFESNDAVFQTYRARKTRGYDTSFCDADCKAAEICQMRAADAQHNCITIKPGVHFKRDDSSTAAGVPAADDHGHVAECDGSKAAPILSSISTTTEGLETLKSVLSEVLGPAFLNQQLPDFNATSVSS
ncbi:hypothetical protein PspLS_11811 [Pyricularia sp. CBS 133598]|nr:hypothetical protein PspLS_11811 [Pyricularia sp. CBS 133598]